MARKLVRGFYPGATQMGLYVATEMSLLVHCDGSVATYPKGLWTYMYLLGIFLFVHWGALGLQLPENLGYLLIVTCTQSEVPIV